MFNTSKRSPASCGRICLIKDRSKLRAPLTSPPVKMSSTTISDHNHTFPESGASERPEYVPTPALGSGPCAHLAAAPSANPSPSTALPGLTAGAQSGPLGLWELDCRDR